jgi:hypothetical protein
MDGEHETGVDIMRMEAGLDTGPIAAASARADQTPTTTPESCSPSSRQPARRILFDALERADAGTIEFTPQPDEGATYAHKITATDRRCSTPPAPRAPCTTRCARSARTSARGCNVDGQRLGHLAHDRGTGTDVRGSPVGPA